MSSTRGDGGGGGGGGVYLPAIPCHPRDVAVPQLPNSLLPRYTIKETRFNTSLISHYSFSMDIPLPLLVLTNGKASLSNVHL